MNNNITFPKLLPLTLLRDMKPLLMLGLVVLLSACSGNGDNSPDARDGEYDGVWDVSYNLVTDDCGITGSEVTGFLDVHNISQSGSDVAVEANVGFGEPLNGQLADDGSFLVEQNVSGDLFGDGINCSSFQSISYQPQDADSANSLYLRQITCDDGFFCESQAVGTSSRR